MSARTKQRGASTQQLFYALAEPTRRNIVEMLATQGKLAATEISNNFTISPQAISQHLKVLRDTDIVNVERKAQQRIYRMNPDSMQELSKWVAKMKDLWEERYEALDRVLAAEKKKAADKQ